MTSRSAALFAADRLVWRLEKATNRESWRGIHRAADGAVSQWIRSFVASIKAVRKGIDGPALVKALKAGDVAAAMKAIPWEALETDLAQQYYRQIGDLAMAGARVAAKDAGLTVDWVATGGGSGAAPPRTPAAGGTGDANIHLRFDLANPKNDAAVAKHTARLVVEVGDETREAIKSLVSNAFETGVPPAKLGRQVREHIGLTTTQSTAVRNYREFLGTLAERDSLDSLGRGGRARLARGLRSQASVSPIVREGLSSAKIDAMVDAYGTRLLNERADNIARTECLPGETLIDAAVVRAVFRRWYDGSIVEITTRAGRKLSATPNHPMLTSRGWLAAGQIAETDYLICGEWDQNTSTSRDPDVNNGPSTIAEIFDSLAAIVVPERVRGGKPDFHGDGMDGDVDILRPDGELLIGRFAPLYEPIIEQILSPSDMIRAPLCRGCRRLLSIDEQPCLCGCPGANTGFFESGSDCARIDAQMRCNIKNGLTGSEPGENVINGEIGQVIAGKTAMGEELSAGAGQIATHSSFADYARNVIDTESGGFGDCCATQTRQIHLDCVESVRLRKFSGHVYNLSTPFGYFAANQVYTGNTLKAANAGQDMLWNEAIAQKQLDRGRMQRTWIITPDDRLCELCEQMVGDRALSEIGGTFDFPEFGDVESPPGHPRCRCAIGLVRKEAA